MHRRHVPWPVVALLVGSAVAVAAVHFSPEVKPGKLYPERDLAEVVQRVERLRGLKFKEVPTVRILEEPEIGKVGEAAEAEELPEAQQRLAEQGLEAGVTLYKLTGNVPAGFDAKELETAVAADLGGFYAREAGIFLVRDDADLLEIALVHELTHALEDQHFGFNERLNPVSEEAGAELALREGTATLAIVQDIREQFGPVPIEEFLSELRAAESAGDVPPILDAILTFPYLSGTIFADELYQRSGSWKSLNTASAQPPVSTELILHPERWPKADPPLKVEVSAEELSREGWSRQGGYEVGEFEVALLIGGGSAEATDRASTGWEGGMLETWERKEPNGCRQPCRQAHVALIGLAWESPADAREFAQAAASTLEREPLNGTKVGRDTWRIGDGAAAIVRRGLRTAWVFAPSPELAQSLAKQNAAPAATRGP